MYSSAKVFHSRAGLSALSMVSFVQFLRASPSPQKVNVGNKKIFFFFLRVFVCFVGKSADFLMFSRTLSVSYDSSNQISFKIYF